MNQSGATWANNYYYPYGGNRGGAFSNLTTKRFTGQYHESSLPGGEGLSYYGARWYDPKLGRFLSADTIVPGPANPQAFNRYSYVFNNPLRFTDPTGHDPCENGGRCWGEPSRPRPTTPAKPINLPGSETQPIHRVFYLNGLGGHPLYPSADALGEYDYLYYRLQDAFGENNVIHIPLFTDPYRRGWSHLEMFQEGISPFKPWTDVATTTIAIQLELHPLRPGERLVLVGSSAGGTVAMEMLSRLKEKNIHVNQVVLRGSFVHQLFLSNVDSVDYIAASPPWSDQWYSLDMNPFDGVDVQQHIATKLYGHSPSGSRVQIHEQLQELGDLVIDSIIGAR